MKVDYIKQVKLFKFLKPASLAIVCGPDGFIDYVAGAKDLVRNKQGPVNGLLGDKNGITPMYINYRLPYL